MNNDPQNGATSADIPHTLRNAAAVIVDDAGRLLLVRKRGTDRFMQAGGKVDVGETAVHAVVRELFEEIGLVVDPEVMQYWGRFHAVAANEHNHVVDAESFYIAVSHATAVEIAAAAEIDEIVWVTPAQALELPLAPLTRDVLLPRLVSR